MGDIFLSYSRVDQDVVTKLVQRLEQRGFSVWWDGEIPPGENYRTFIDRKLNEAPAICVVWSSNSARSRWVAEEAEEGVTRQNLIPISIEACDIPRGFKSFQSVQLLNTLPTERYEEEFEKLVAQLTRFTQAASTRKPRTRKTKPSALSYPAARNQNLAMTVVFAFTTLAFAFYDFVIDPGNAMSLWFRVGVVVPTFLLFTLGFYLGRQTWQLWLLNVSTSAVAMAVIYLQIEQIRDPNFQPGAMGQIVTACVVLVGSGACLAHSHSSRAASLIGILGVFFAFAFIRGVNTLPFWATAIANLFVVAVFVWLGFYLRDRRAR